MPNKQRFDLSDPRTRNEIEEIHDEYMNSERDVEGTAHKYGVGHNTLRRMFKLYGLPLKVNRTTNPEEVRVLQRELEAPLDYLAAKYRVHENTVRIWLKNSRWKHKKFQGAAAKVWWQSVGQTCNGPNDFFHLMTHDPHNLAPERVPRLYHRRFKPNAAILWELNLNVPARVLEDTEIPPIMCQTVPDTKNPRPRMFLGTKSRINAVAWDESTTNELDGEYDETESDLDIYALAEEMGVDL